MRNSLKSLSVASVAHFLDAKFRLVQRVAAALASRLPVSASWLGASPNHAAWAKSDFGL
jgi:hypothetical protein